MQNEKSKVTISYGDNLNNLKYGNFDNIPENPFITIITIHTPIIKDNGTIEYENFSHRMFLGDLLPASLFVEAYGKNVSFTELTEIKEAITNSNGQQKIITPFNSKDGRFVLADKNDAVYSNYEELVNAITKLKSSIREDMEIINSDEPNESIKR